MKNDVAKLASFGTRHTLSDTLSPTRGIGAARTWVKAELASYGGLDVRFDPHLLAADGARIPAAVEIVNVVATLPGSMPQARGRQVYVVAHLDSRATDVMDATTDAPGANDDASGVAVVLEAARVMAKSKWDATVVFLVTVGEEQGLYGAKLYAARARADKLDVRAVLNDDIVGDPSDPRGGTHDRILRVFSEGLPVSADAEEIARIRKLGAESDAPSRQLARYVAEVAVWEACDVTPVLVFRSDRFLRGGDHLAFSELGIPAIRFTTLTETFTRQHQDVRREGAVRYGDVPEHVDADFLARVARLNVAALAHLANAPSSPQDARVVTAELGIDVLLRWEPSPEPDVAGYEVVWRATTSPVWERSRDVGRTLEASLPLSKDDLLFGVRSYDRDGYRSPVSFARAAPK